MKKLRSIPRIRATVPNRVDLAGGTLDIYPLYLLVPGCMTVNAAIGIHSIFEIGPGSGPARLVSEDFSQSAEAPDTHGFSTGGKLGLIASSLRFFPPVKGVSIRFRNEAPLGSGLGASSALLVASMLAMDSFSGRKREWEDTARKAMEIEAGYLRCLTGCQDHIAALRGGLQGIRFKPAVLETEKISCRSDTGRMLAAHGFLAGTGIAHLSGNVNWRMIRGAIDGDRRILGKFRGIAAAAHEAWDAVRNGNAEGIGRAVAQEWKIRKTLARGVSPPKVEKLFSSRGFRKRVGGAKLCGAGGGGMIFGVLRSPEDRKRVEEIIEAEGCRVFPFRLSDGPLVEVE